MGKPLSFPSGIQNDSFATDGDAAKATYGSIVEALSVMLNVLDGAAARLEQLDAIFPMQGPLAHLKEQRIEILDRISAAHRKLESLSNANKVNRND